MNCINCTNVKTHKGGKLMAAQGFSGCALRPIYEYHPVDTERKCADFKPAPAEVTAKRAAWLNKREVQA